MYFRITPSKVIKDICNETSEEMKILEMETYLTYIVRTNSYLQVQYKSSHFFTEIQEKSKLYMGTKRRRTARIKLGKEHIVDILQGHFNKSSMDLAQNR